MRLVCRQNLSGIFKSTALALCCILPVSIWVPAFSRPLTSEYTGNSTSNKSISSPEPSISEIYSDLYTLGPGDGLALTFLDPELKTLEGPITILPDGTAVLPLIGSVQLSDLTLGQATRWLTSLYQKQVVRPQLLLSLRIARPTKVTVIGEVLKPGLIELTGRSEHVIIARVVNAIQRAGGITPNADIRRVLLRRVVGQNGAQKQTFINLAEVFLLGNQFQNPVLFDGDTIIVGRAAEPIPDEVVRIGRTNLAPASINVTIIGEVKSAGTLSLPANTPLIEAIFRAGGLKKWRANKNHIELIRFNDNGTTTRQAFSYKDDLNVSNGFNPPLRDRDTIIVNRTFYGEAIDALTDIAVPIGIINSLGGLGNNWGWNNR